MMPELSARFTLSGYEPQIVLVRSDATADSPRLAPNPVYAELRPLPAAPPVKKRIKKKPDVAARANKSVASAVPAIPSPVATTAPAPAPATEESVSATNYPWPEPPNLKGPL